MKIMKVELLQHTNYSNTAYHLSHRRPVLGTLPTYSLTSYFEFANDIILFVNILFKFSDVGLSPESD